ncbi:PHB depolymerase family esterase [Aquisalimonas sp. APHAB1-3]|uniref:extracellular catalytic domain type 1 short-chain-length polyhydroxyalkanoate depolymerase n=2 Tax=unclassified Aquisalimonas TaxID=2644645 RepID=UPI003AADF0E0
MTIRTNPTSSWRLFTFAAPLAALVLLFSPFDRAIAIDCGPGFESLPGCSDSGSDEGGSSGGDAAEGAWSEETIAGMNVQIYMPDSEPVLGDERALMVNLHGCTQTNTDLMNAGNWEATADEFGMVVVLPNAPGGGVLLGCWDYYDSNHTRTNRHNGNLLDLVGEMLDRNDMTVDPDQVYISGLSSGGSQAMVMGCLAPDVFAGFGNNAGPTVGTGSGDIGFVSTSEAQGRNTCEDFAGNNTSEFDTQIASVIYGDNDDIVAPGYNPLNADIMASIYGADATSPFSLDDLRGNNTSGSGTLFEDADGPRVSLIQNTGMGHNWPAGAGNGGSYITSNSIDYPHYLTTYLFANNRRIDDAPDDPGNGDDGNGDDGNGDDGNGDDDNGFACTETTSSTYDHVEAGRAYQSGGTAYAQGSDDNLGLWNLFNEATLAETDEGYFEEGTCP